MLDFSVKGLYAVHFPNRFHEPGSCGTNQVRERVIGRNSRMDLTGFTPFQLKVYAALGKVPVGKTITYGELAKRAGYPGAARTVGTAMKKNRLPIVIPCHRVVPASGGLGEYSAGKPWKRWLLEWEKCVIIPKTKEGEFTCSLKK
jgi:methylated-DNA-[protein]-cysteine S-methyltransferase